MLVSQKSQRLKRVRIITITSLFIVLLLGGAYIFWFTAIFKIQSVVVDGAVLTNTQSIDGAVGKNILLWKVPPDILDSIRVASVDVKKDILERNVYVRINERKKTTIWCLEKIEQCFWVDENGVIFNPASRPSGSLVVDVMRDYTDRSLSIGDAVLPNDLLGNLQSIFNLLNKLDLSVDELRIDDLKFKEVTAIIGKGPEIYFSLTLDPKFGEGVLESLMSSSDWGRIRYVDLRVENRAYYSF